MSAHNDMNTGPSRPSRQARLMVALPWHVAVLAPSLLTASTFANALVDERCCCC